MKIRLELVKKISKKLQLVKAVKLTTGLGLKDAKDIVDKLINIGDVVEFDIKEIYISSNGEKINCHEYLRKEILDAGSEVSIILI